MDKKLSDFVEMAQWTINRFGLATHIILSVDETKNEVDASGVKAQSVGRGHWLVEGHDEATLAEVAVAALVADSLQELVFDALLERRFGKKGKSAN